MSNKKKQYRAFRSHSVSEAFQSLVERKGDPAIERRLSLWRQWDAIMGSPITDLGFPVETKGKTIIMGVENPMAMQELSMLAPTILHRANSFLGETMFTKVVFTQKEHRQRQMQSQGGKQPSLPESAMPPPPKGFGRKLSQFSDDSLVSQCYRALYQAYFTDRPKD